MACERWIRVDEGVNDEMRCRAMLAGAWTGGVKIPVGTYKVEFPEKFLSGETIVISPVDQKRGDVDGDYYYVRPWEYNVFQRDTLRQAGWAVDVRTKKLVRIIEFGPQETVVQYENEVPYTVSTAYEITAH